MKFTAIIILCYVFYRIHKLIEEKSNIPSLLHLIRDISFIILLAILAIFVFFDNKIRHIFVFILGFGIAVFYFTTISLFTGEMIVKNVIIERNKRPVAFWFQVGLHYLLSFVIFSFYTFYFIIH